MGLNAYEMNSILAVAVILLIITIAFLIRKGGLIGHLRGRIMTLFRRISFIRQREKHETSETCEVESREVSERNEVNNGIHGSNGDSLAVILDEHSQPQEVPEHNAVSVYETDSSTITEGRLEALWKLKRDLQQTVWSQSSFSFRSIWLNLAKESSLGSRASFAESTAPRYGEVKNKGTPRFVLKETHSDFEEFPVYTAQEASPEGSTAEASLKTAIGSSETGTRLLKTAKNISIYGQVFDSENEESDQNTYRGNMATDDERKASPKKGPCIVWILRPDDQKDAPQLEPDLNTFDQSESTLPDCVSLALFSKKASAHSESEKTNKH